MITLAGPPLLDFAAVLAVALLFLFFSSRPLPNIRKSDLAGFVDARKEAIRINLDIRGKERMPAWDGGAAC